MRLEVFLGITIGVAVVVMALVIAHYALAGAPAVLVNATAVLDRGVGVCTEVVATFRGGVGGVLVYYQYSFSVPLNVVAVLRHGYYTTVIGVLPQPYFIEPGVQVIVRGYVREGDSYVFTNAVYTTCPGNGVFMIDPGLNISWVNPYIGGETPLGWSISPSNPGFNAFVCHNGTTISTTTAVVVLGNSFLSSGEYTLSVSATCNVTVMYLGEKYSISNGTITINATPNTAIFIAIPQHCRATLTGEAP